MGTGSKFCDPHKLIDLNAQGVALFERAKRGSIVGGSVSLGVCFKFQKLNPTLSISVGSRCRTLGHFSSAMCAAILPTMVMD